MGLSVTVARPSKNRFEVRAPIGSHECRAGFADRRSRKHAGSGIMRRVKSVVPEPDDDEASAATKAGLVRLYDEIAGTYGTALDLFEAFGRDLVAAAGIERGDRVLDVGCGRGACLRPASEAVGEVGFVLGIDVSSAMVALLSQQLEREGTTNAEVRVRDADRVEFADDGSFDAVTCGFVVHHLLHLTATLNEYRRVLRHGGRFAASTFADGTLDYPWVLEALVETGRFGADQPRQHKMLGAPELTQSLIEAEYESIVTTRVAHRFVFADVDAYVTWVRTQGLGTVINRLDPEQLQRFVDACARRLDQHHAAPDGYELLKSIDLTVAARP
jgi:ubiquinone/menaquinone biosynthesis C-methylase UbiE